MLRQLSYYIGDETFKKGVQSYMKKYAYKNTRFQDLLDELSSAHGESLNEWANTWLKTAGLNRVATELSCEAGKITQLSLIQSAPAAHPQLREQRFQVGLYNAENGTLAAPDVLKVTMKGEKTHIPEAEGKACPALVLPNLGDYAYMKVVLDETTRANLNQYLGQIEDAHARTLFWIALRDGVYDGRYAMTDYLNVALEQLQSEADLQILAGVTRTLRRLQRWLMLSEDESHLDLREQVYSQLSALALQRLNASDSQSDAFQVWLALYNSIAVSDPEVEQLSAWLKAGDINGWTIDPSRRWTFLAVMAERRVEGIEALLEKEKSADASARAHRFYMDAKTRLASAEEKMALYQTAMDIENGETLNNRRAILDALAPTRQAEFFREAGQAMYREWMARADEFDAEMSRQLTSRVVPYRFTCEAQWSEFVNGLLANQSVKNKDMVEAMMESVEGNDGCVKALALLP